MPVTAVTGSASGIGAAVCKALEAAGHKIIGIDRANADINADLSTAEGRDAAVTAILDKCEGKLDGLVCCAGLGVTAPTEGLIVSVNYFGVTALIEGLEEALSKGKNPAALIIGSVASIQQMADVDDTVKMMLDGDEAAAVEASNTAKMPQIAYSGSKYAVTIYARRKAVEWGKKGIRLNVIAPGAVETPLHKASQEDPRFGEAVKNFVAPIGRSGTPDEIAEAVAFLQSEKGSFVHGTVMFVDGGMDAMMRSNYF